MNDSQKDLITRIIEIQHGLAEMTGAERNVMEMFPRAYIRVANHSTAEGYDD